MEIINRPFLTAEQLDWAGSLGISPKRAYWLASCPKNTKCGIHNRPKRTFKFRPNRYLHKYGNIYIFRLKRQGVFIMRKLSRDLNEARQMRDVIEREMNLKPILKFA